MKSIFLSNLQYFYGKLDGSYDFPNSVEGDLLKTAKREIEQLQKELSEARCKPKFNQPNYKDIYHPYTGE
jgi:hypothetical protein